MKVAFALGRVYASEGTEFSCNGNRGDATAFAGRCGLGTSITMTLAPVGSASLGSAALYDPLSLKAISNALSLASLSSMIR